MFILPLFAWIFSSLDMNMSVSVLIFVEFLLHFMQEKPAWTESYKQEFEQP